MFSPHQIYLLNGRQGVKAYDASIEVINDSWPWDADYGRTMQPSIAYLPDANQIILTGISRRYNFYYFGKEAEDKPIIEGSLAFYSIGEYRNGNIKWHPRRPIQNTQGAYLSGFPLSNLGKGGLRLGLFVQAPSTFDPNPQAENFWTQLIQPANTGPNPNAIANMWTPILVVDDEAGFSRYIASVNESPITPDMTDAEKSKFYWSKLPYMPTGNRMRGELWQSTEADGGISWSRLTHPDQFIGINESVNRPADDPFPSAYEISLAYSGGKIIAAGRTNTPFADNLANSTDYFTNIDDWDGLSVASSLQPDPGEPVGARFESMKPLFNYGHKYQCMVVLPNGIIVMTYAASMGGYEPYLPGHELDFGRFGVEAIVSKDHGASWDLDHRYFLANWRSDSIGPPVVQTQGGVQATSTVILDPVNGELLTVFGSGYRSEPNPLPSHEHPPRCDYKIDFGPNGRGFQKEAAENVGWMPHRYHMDFVAVKWRLNPGHMDSENRGELNTDSDISQAPYTGTIRNRFDAKDIQRMLNDMKMQR